MATALAQQSGGQVVIRRSTYTLAGQTIAVRVSGDPDTTKNGLFYLYSDHLGSTSAIQNPDGTVTRARYLPFGGWRTEPGSLPTSHGYTGHVHNNLGSSSADDLGLIYMQARFYVPYRCVLSGEIGAILGGNGSELAIVNH